MTEQREIKTYKIIIEVTKKGLFSTQTHTFTEIVETDKSIKELYKEWQEELTNTSLIINSFDIIEIK